MKTSYAHHIMTHQYEQQQQHKCQHQPQYDSREEDKRLRLRTHSQEHQEYQQASLFWYIPWDILIYHIFPYLQDKSVFCCLRACRSIYHECLPKYHVQKPIFDIVTVLKHSSFQLDSTCPIPIIHRCHNPLKSCSSVMIATSQSESVCCLNPYVEYFWEAF